MSLFFSCKLSHQEESSSPTLDLNPAYIHAAYIKLNLHSEVNLDEDKKPRKFKKSRQSAVSVGVWQRSLAEPGGRWPRPGSLPGRQGAERLSLRQEGSCPMGKCKNIH